MQVDAGADSTARPDVCPDDPSDSGRTGSGAADLRAGPPYAEVQD